MQIYYDSDADQNIAKGMEIVIIGYGSQGHAHANNLKDSGANVTVALRKNLDHGQKLKLLVLMSKR